MKGSSARRMLAVGREKEGWKVGRGDCVEGCAQIEREARSSDDFRVCPVKVNSKLR